MKTHHKVAIIEDLELYTKILQVSLSSFTNVTIVGTATTVPDAEKLIHKQQPDLVFLDVKLDDKGNGFDLLRKLKNRYTNMCTVIFSCDSKYAVTAYRESAFYFLHKPYEQSEFVLVMNRYFAFKDKEVEKQIAAIAPPITADSVFMISTITGLQIIQLNTIGYVEYLSKRKLWMVALTNGSKLFLKRNTIADTIVNYSTAFIQISQRHIINANYLSKIEAHRCILLHPFDRDCNLVVSRNYLSVLRNKFNRI